MPCAGLTRWVVYYYYSDLIAQLERGNRHSLGLLCFGFLFPRSLPPTWKRENGVPSNGTGLGTTVCVALPEYRPHCRSLAHITHRLQTSRAVTHLHPFGRSVFFGAIMVKDYYYHSHPFLLSDYLPSVSPGTPSPGQPTAQE